MAVWDIYHSADFCGSEHDDFLITCYTDEDKKKFVKDWCDRHAEKMLPRDASGFSVACRRHTDYYIS